MKECGYKCKYFGYTPLYNDPWCSKYNKVTRDDKKCFDNFIKNGVLKSKELER